MELLFRNLITSCLQMLSPSTHGSLAGAVTQCHGSRSAAAVAVLASESIFFSAENIF